jgi:excisionase family DNA binding protein
MSQTPGKLPKRANDGSQNQFEPLLDSNEAAELLKIHPKTLQRMARRGEIPSIQIGKLWRFRGSELNAWAQGIIAHSYPCRLNSERREQ